MQRNTKSLMILVKVNSKMAFKMYLMTNYNISTSMLYDLSKSKLLKKPKLLSSEICSK